MDKKNVQYHTTEYYSAIKRNEVLICATVCMNLYNIILSKKKEKSNTKGHILHDFIHMKCPE